MRARPPLAADAGPRQPAGMSIRDWPEDSRPRERLLRHGPAGLAPAELIAVLLGSGVRGLSAVELGQRLLAQAGSLSALLNAPEACRGGGLGPAKRARLLAALELARRSLGEELAARPALNTPAESAAFLRAQLRDRAYEVFAVLFLDNRHRVTSPSRSCSAARSTAPACHRARWCAPACATTRRR